jgi:hypothetical protein
LTTLRVPGVKKASALRQLPAALAVLCIDRVDFEASRDPLSVIGMALTRLHIGEVEDAAAAAQLAALCPHLQRIQLVCRGSRFVEVLAAFAQLASLVGLAVETPRHAAVPVRDVTRGLEALRRPLQRLCLPAMDCGGPCVSLPFSPHLRKLRFNIETPIFDEASAAALAQACPNVADLSGARVQTLLAVRPWLALAQLRVLSVFVLQGDGAQLASIAPATPNTTLWKLGLEINAAAPMPLPPLCALLDKLCGLELFCLVTKCDGVKLQKSDEAVMRTELRRRYPCLCLEYAEVEDYGDYVIVD